MWTKLSADKKSELMKAYKKGGFSYKDMINDYNDSYKKFEEGGEGGLPESTPKIYYTADPNDPRIKQHSDSLGLFNQGLSNIKTLRSAGYVPQSVNKSEWKVGTTENKSASLNNGPTVNQSTIAGYNPTQSMFVKNPNTNTGYNVAMYKHPTQDVRLVKQKLENKQVKFNDSPYQNQTIKVEKVIEPKAEIPTLPNLPPKQAKYQTVSGAGTPYYFVDNKPVTKQTYDTMYGGVTEIERGESYKKEMGGIQKYQEGGIEESINKRLGNPMNKAEIDSDYKGLVVDPRTRRQTTSESVDNVRHAAAGRYTQEAIENYANLIPYASAIPGFSKAAGFIGANVLGLGHEASTLFNKNDDDNDTRTMGMKVKESAADAYNNMIGSVIGASNLTPYQKNAYIKYLSETGKIPTGQYNKKKDPTYKKEMGGIQRYEVGGETKPPVINMSLMGTPNFASETTQSQAPASKYAAAEQNKAAIKAAIEGHAETVYNKHLQREELKKKYPTKNQEEIQRIQDKIESPLFYEPAGQLASYATRFHGLTDDEIARITGSGTMGDRLGVAANMGAWALGNEIGAKAIGNFASNASPYIKKGLNAAGKAIGTESGILSNAYKVNPFAFKPNSEMGYRMLGKEGYKDAINTGVIRAKPAPNESFNGISLARNTNRNPNTGKMQSVLDRPYFADGVVDSRYASDYMAEVNKAKNNLVPINTHMGIAPINAGSIPLENSTLYKKDWLQGYKKIPKNTSNFKSEINWGNWNKEIPNNNTLMNEYNAIEQSTKANGSWMKNPDGSLFQGTPEQFVQQNSENFKNAFPEGANKTYRGTTIHNNNLTDNYNSVFTADKAGASGYTRKGMENKYFNPNIPNIEEQISIGAKKYGMKEPVINKSYRADMMHSNEAGMHELYYTNKDKIIADFKNSNFNDIKKSDIPKELLKYLPNKKTYFTDDIAEALEKSNFSSLEIKNIIDPFYIERETIHNLNKSKLKSARGNNGMFDMTNPNIYKALFPTAIGAAALNKNKTNK